MTRPIGGRDFASSPGSFFARFGGAFFGALLLLVLMEQIGLSLSVITVAIPLLLVILYAGIGVGARTLHVDAFFVTGRQMPAVANGMAMAANGLAGAVVVGLAGLIANEGYDALAYGLGLTGGFALIAIAIAPRLRAFEVYTVPDFLSVRFGSDIARLLGLIVLIACSFPFLVAQLGAMGTIAGRFLDLSFQTSVLLSLAVILSCTLLGGMRGVSWTQAAQYVVIAVAYLLPAIWLSVQVAGNPIPPLALGDLVHSVADIERAGGTLSAATLSLLEPQSAPATQDSFNFLALLVTLVAGTAAMPHILTRSLTAPSVVETRRASAWAVVFVAAIVLTAPALGLLVKHEVLALTVGTSVAELADKAGWLLGTGDTGAAIARLCGADAIDLAVVTRACGDSGYRLATADIALNAELAVLAAPEIAGLPFAISALVVVGALSAFLSTANGLLITLSAGLGHDLYHKLLDRRAPTARRIIAARLAVIATAGAAAWATLAGPPDFLTLFEWSFSLAAAGLFPVLVLGLWWSDTTRSAAIVGMIVGFGLTAFYLAANTYGFDKIPGNGDELVWHIPGITTAIAVEGAGILGIAAGFIVIAGLTLVTRERKPRPEPVVPADDAETSEVAGATGDEPASPEPVEAETAAIEEPVEPEADEAKADPKSEDPAAPSTETSDAESETEAPEPGNETAEGDAGDTPGEQTVEQPSEAAGEKQAEDAPADAQDGESVPAAVPASEERAAALEGPANESVPAEDPALDTKADSEKAGAAAKPAGGTKAKPTKRTRRGSTAKSSSAKNGTGSRASRAKKPAKPRSRKKPDTPPDNGTPKG